MRHYCNPLFLCILLTFSLLSIGVRANNHLEQALRQAIANVKATVGIAVITSEGDTVKVNNEGRYPLMSVMKLQ